MRPCGGVCLLVCVCFHRSNAVQSLQKSSLFSFSCCALLALLTAIVSPSSTALPSERGHGEVLSALFENVITIIMMMITVMVKIKGGVSERVSRSWGEVMSAL